MILLERLLFYPALLAASVFLAREALVRPEPPVLLGLGLLAIIWFLVLTRVVFRLVRLGFWLTLIAGAALWWSGHLSRLGLTL